MLHDILIAKSKNADAKWLPLHMHAEDTVGVINKLLDEFMSKSFTNTCKMTERQLRTAMTFLGYVHDIGKATIGFQNKVIKNIPQRTVYLQDAGLDLSTLSEKSFYHAIASEVILRYFGCNDTIAAIAGAHHGMTTNISDIRSQDLSQRKTDITDYEQYYGINKNNKDFLERVWEMIIQNGLKKAGISSVKELPVIPFTTQVILSGLLIVADWIASNENYFPLIDINTETDLILYPERIENGWKKANFPKKWTPSIEEYDDKEFEKTFGFLPRETQRAVLDIVSKIECPGLIIYEAPMGSGKTETALASSEIIATKTDKTGIAIEMPTQATTNGLFPRIKQWAEKQSEEICHSIQLEHGNAAFNDLFKGLQNNETESNLIVHPWVQNTKKSCLADFVVSTIDHFLMTALRRRHVMIPHFGFSEKVIIVDEVHAYDAYMNRYLEVALQWFGTYHTTVILMSATLPSQRRKAFIQAYLNCKITDKAIEENEAYPLLTWTDGNEVKQAALPYRGEHKTIHITKCNDDDIIAVAQKTVLSGGCVGIIVNTVARAQRIYENIYNDVTTNTLLYHAQFTTPDRNRKENELMTRIGKDSTIQTRQSFVVVGTQVLEQSLDIDFDVLITDVCPIDLLLQRIGRLQRHERCDRPQAVSSATCYVVTDEYTKEQTGTKAIYGQWLLKETLDVLSDQIIIPDDISPLVQKVYSAYDSSDEYLQYQNDIKMKQDRAGAFIMKRPTGKDIHGLLDRTIDDKDNAAEASVRDGIPSIEVILMIKDADDNIFFIDKTLVSDEPSCFECEEIAKQTIKLPSVFNRKWTVEQTVTALKKQCESFTTEWQQSNWLKGKLVLFLDENMQAELLDKRMEYSYEKGLQMI